MMNTMRFIALVGCHLSNMDATLPSSGTIENEEYAELGLPWETKGSVDTWTYKGTSLGVTEGGGDISVWWYLYMCGDEGGYKPDHPPCWHGSPARRHTQRRGFDCHGGGAAALQYPPCSHDGRGGAKLGSLVRWRAAPTSVQRDGTPCPEGRGVGERPCA
jgi:hypothetical protein